MGVCVPPILLDVHELCEARGGRIEAGELRESAGTVQFCSLSVNFRSSELLDLLMDCADEEFEASMKREAEVFDWICSAARDTRQVRWVDWEDEGDIYEAIDFGAGYAH